MYSEPAGQKEANGKTEGTKWDALIYSPMS